MTQIYANNLTTLSLGRQGENLARQVVFDIRDLESLYGSGTVEVIYNRPGDAQPYPLAVQRDGTLVTWDVTATDTEMDSYGKCELRYYAGETLAKSQIWRTWVESAMETPSETAPPEPEQGWVDQVLEVGVSVKEATDSAKTYANSAEQSASGAAQSAQEAAESASAAQQSATSAAESAAVYDTVVADVTQLKADIITKADKTALAKTDRSLDALWKLNQGISYQFETDDTAAYQKTVPSGAKLASVKSIGGKTVVWNQMVNPTLETSTKNGVTATRNDDGSFTVNGTAEKDALFSVQENIQLFSGHKYLLLGCPKNGGDLYSLLFSDTSNETTWKTLAKDTGSGAIYNCTSDLSLNVIRIAVFQNSAVENLVFKPMLFDITNILSVWDETVSTDDPRIAWIEQYAAAHPEYNAGELVSADVESVVERGRNLLNLTGQTETVNGITIINNGNGTYTVNGTATKNVYYHLCYEQFPSGTYRLSGAPTVASKSTFFLSAYQDDVWKGSDLGSGLVFDVKGNPKNIKFSRFEIVVLSGTTVDNVLFKPMITVYPSEFNDFEPYHLNTYAIPAAVRNLPGYGWSAGSVRNSIERTENGWQYVQRVGSVDLGDLSYGYSDSNKWFYYPASSIPNCRIISSTTDLPNILAASYQTIRRIDITAESNMVISMNTTPNIIFRDSRYANAEDFKSAMSGAMLYYELAEPIITDITDLMADFQESFPVEAGGTITFENAAKLTVPNSVEYVVSLAEVGSV